MMFDVEVGGTVVHRCGTWKKAKSYAKRLRTRTNHETVAVNPHPVRGSRKTYKVV